MSAFKSEKYLSDVDLLLAGPAGENLENLELLEDDEEDTFQPQKGNVAFVCALDGWGFRINEFAEFYVSKLGASAAALQKALWGPKYYNQKTKMIVGKKGMGGGSKARPMFVQFVLEPLWQVYQAALEPDGDKSMLQKVIKSFNLNVPARELQHKDPKSCASSCVESMASLSDAILSMVVKCIPDPMRAQSFRISRLLPKREVSDDGPSSNVLAEAELVRKSVEACDFSPEAPCVAFVSKCGSGESDECFIAFARVFSGVLFAGQRVFVLSALYDPLKPEAMQKHVQEAELHSLYLMMGQGLKTSGISEGREYCGNPRPWPAYIEKYGCLMKGLRLLNRADPFVEVSVSARGEHVLAAAGEETPNGRCCVRVQVLKLPPSLTKVLDKSADLLRDIIGGKLGQSNKSSETQRSSRLEDENSIEALRKRIMDAVEGDILGGIEESDKDRAEKCKAMWLQFLKRIWALGPRQIGPNILFTPDSRGEDAEFPVLVRGSSHVSERLGFVDESSNGGMDAEPSSVVTPALCMEAESLESSVISGFQLATAAGPLCEEPMWGLAFVIEARISPLEGQQSDDLETSYQPLEQYGIFTGQVMNTVKDACRTAVLQKKPRLVEAMYFCELNTPTEYLGPMYAVLARRRARVLKEEMQEGSSLFTVHAYVPVSESFGFPDELRRWTSGASSALLVLSHWEALPEDPFFVPKTEEEIEEFGDGSSVLHNTARKLIDAVRRQKGLPVEEKVVQHATKQRTLARKV
ncbi:Elongation factor-like GTPase 1 [Vitis vinifera]|uniref:Elongation factor-like GTPase 1 n=1 Tax=Vitis vinifera TaxID=29760 RepID=A0A438D264_VITVI|nr:Elongation factor-like GTPase 1 [Vitis vinifera]